LSAFNEGCVDDVGSVLKFLLARLVVLPERSFWSSNVRATLELGGGQVIGVIFL
jgi:hypothetical protein